MHCWWRDPSSTPLCRAYGAHVSEFTQCTVTYERLWTHGQGPNISGTGLVQISVVKFLDFISLNCAGNCGTAVSDIHFLDGKLYL